MAPQQRINGGVTVERIVVQPASIKPQRPENPLLKFRPPGAPAGVWHHDPWWHCCFHDPYERVNVWSHGVPGLMFLCLAVASCVGLTPGGRTMVTFACCAGANHMLSALAHVWPDSHLLEKLDHLGIVALIVGTPISALMALEHGHLPVEMRFATAAMLIAAFLPPLPRVLGFASGVIAIVVLFGLQILNGNLGVQLVLYSLSGLTFLRNGGHQRGTGLSDHHLLHYFVTTACLLHIKYILDAIAAS